VNESTPSGAPNPDDPTGSNVPPEPKKESPQSEQPRPRNTGQILGEQQCVAGLSQLPGLLAIGYMKAPTSNAMRAVYNDLLRYYERTGRDTAQTVQVDADMIAILRENPAMLNMLEPLLTDELLKMVLGEATDGDQKT
jgi:hypothetical protein